MGGVVSAIFGGGDSKPDNSAQMAQMEADNKAQREKMEVQQKKLDDEARSRNEEAASRLRARRGGGARALMDAQRLNPEVGLPGQESATRKTLGPQ